MSYKKAFTMIELIIAIVIIGIVTLVLPSVINQTNNNAVNALKDEGINALSIIMYGDRTFPFDNNSNNNILDIVDCTDVTHPYCDDNSIRNPAITGLTRIGIPVFANHRRFHTPITNPDLLNNSPLIKTNEDLLSTTSSHASKALYKYSTELHYVHDNNNLFSTKAATVPGQSNMKLMTYTLHQADSSGVFQDIAIFRQYKLNIGTPELLLW